MGVWPGGTYFNLVLYGILGSSGQGWAGGLGTLYLRVLASEVVLKISGGAQSQGGSAIFGSILGHPGVVFVRNIESDFGRSRYENGRYTRYAWVTTWFLQ